MKQLRSLKISHGQQGEIKKKKTDSTGTYVENFEKMCA